MTPSNPDPQKDTLYDWEDMWWGWNISVLTLKECRHIINSACYLYRLKPPKVIQHKKRSLSYSQGDVISLQAKGPRVIGGNKGGLNFATAVHEAAHYITDKRYGLNLQEHGPEFMAVYLKLLVKAKIAPATAIYESAKAVGLTWHDSPKLQPSPKRR